MYTEYKFIFSIGSVTRSSRHDSFEYINSLDLNAWSNAVDLFKIRKYFHANMHVTVSVDLEPVLQHFKESAKTDVEFENIIKKNGDIDTWSKNHVFKDIPDLCCSISINTDNEPIDNEFSIISGFAERYIYDLFAIMNFSVPGSCDFNNIEIHTNKKDHSSRLNLSGYYFELGLMSTLDGKKPSLSTLSVADVLKWYNALNIGLKQKAELPIERALFSLFHICLLDSDVTSIIWIFHALEAIYSSKVGEGFTNLHRRISYLLKLDKKDQTILKKNLRKLYDFRSAIVHGGYQVYHPSSNEMIDSEYDDDINTFYRLNEYGFKLIVSSIQELIKNNWYGLLIDESIKGKETTN
ncbi:MAG: HEPN domain-containing protein [Deltaproteobacteria bacterium]|nr:HEPN domain-containing protein [Deltaproteobacteria bacterium]